MIVDPKQATYKFGYQNQQYLFYSQHCLDSFKRKPDEYLHPRSQSQNKSINSPIEYTCPMHPEIVQDHPGNCSIRGMALEPKNIEAKVDDAEYKNMRLRFWVGLAFSIPVLLLAMGNMIPAFDHIISQNFSRWLQFIFSTPVILWSKISFLLWKNYKQEISSAINEIEIESQENESWMTKLVNFMDEE